MLKLQVINDNDVKRITVRELGENEKPKGREAFYHPDCIIFLVGRDNDMVAYNLQLALQDRNMPVIALRRIKRGKK